MLNRDLVEAPSFKAYRTSRFKVSTGTPMRLSMTTTNHRDHDVLYTKAIYRLEGDVLTYCVGAPGQPRPTSFSTVQGDGNTLVELKRGARNESR